MKKFAITFVLLLVLSPLVLYIGIVLTNDFVANQVTHDLKDYPLPAEAVLVDSLSAAGKFVGNGNGMQYVGAILITSELSKDDIATHYQQQFDYVEVYQQSSATVHPYDFRFNKFKPNRDDRYFTVLCWGSARDYVPDWLSRLLNFDPRGH